MVGKRCCSFPMSAHSFDGVFGSSEVLLLLENSVARKKEGDEHLERGGMGYAPLLVLEESILPAACGEKGAGCFHRFGVKVCFSKDKCVYRISVLLLEELGHRSWTQAFARRVSHQFFINVFHVATHS